MQILVESVRKSYSGTKVLRDLSFSVPSGHVTLLAGPNGSGKSTLLRCTLGLESPDQGRILLDGQLYEELDSPARTIGALLDSNWLDPQLTAFQNLEILARLSDIPDSNVHASLERCGLATVADKRVATFSLGMRQRCGIAAALLGEPKMLVLDEPVNGLDPSGMRWLHSLIRDHAFAGGTVLVSSHFLDDSQSYADHIVIIGKGEALWEGPIDSLTGSNKSTRFRSSDDAAVIAELGTLNYKISENYSLVIGVAPEVVCAASRRADVELYYLEAGGESLSDAFERISRGKVEFH